MFPTASPLFLLRRGTEAGRAVRAEGTRGECREAALTGLKSGGAVQGSQMALAMAKVSDVWKLFSAQGTDAGSSVEPLPTAISKDPLDPGLPSEEILERSDFLEPLGTDALDEMAEILRTSARPTTSFVTRVLKAWRGSQEQQ